MTTARPCLPAELQLQRRALHRIDDPAGLEIVCREGTVWLTLDHDVRDIVLEPGDRFATQEHHQALLFALAPARLTVSHTPPAARPAQQRGQARAGWFKAARASSRWLSAPGW